MNPQLKQVNTQLKPQFNEGSNAPTEPNEVKVKFRQKRVLVETIFHIYAKKIYKIMQIALNKQQNIHNKNHKRKTKVSKESINYY